GNTICVGGPRAFSPATASRRAVPTVFDAAGPCGPAVPPCRPPWRPGRISAGAASAPRLSLDRPRTLPQALGRRFSGGRVAAGEGRVIDDDARPHRRGDGNLLQVHPLRGRGL